MNNESTTGEREFRVRFFRNVTTCDRHTVVVRAADADAARAKVEAWGKGELELTDAEADTEHLEKEGEVQDSEFWGLEDADNPYAVEDATGEIDG